MLSYDFASDKHFFLSSSLTGIHDVYINGFGVSIVAFLAFSYT